MSDGSPTLEVGFEIDTSTSFGALEQLENGMDRATASILAEAAKVERATGGMVKLGGATAQVTTFGNAATREMQGAARDIARVEKAGERMVGQMARQAEVFGKSASEIRQMRAELRATEAESRGLTELAARLRAASAEIDRLEASGSRMGAGFNRNSHTMMQFGMQMNDVATMAALGAPPMQIFASQIGQIVQVAQGAEGGVRGFATQLGGLVFRFAPVIAAVGGAVAAFGLFSRAVTDDIDTQAMVESLGLTRAEMKRLENTTIGVGDVVTATFQVMAERVGLDLSRLKGWFGDALDFMTTAGRNALAAIYAQFVGTFRAISAIVQGVFAGKSIGDIMTDVGNAYTGAFEEANSALTKFGEDVTAQLRSNKMAELRKQADEIKKDRATPAPKVDRHAEQLQREAAAIEAQTRNLYALADAYRISGAEALIAEARVAAESKAIKQRGDIAAAVEREIRLEIAKRVSDASKDAAAMRDQARAQGEVNGLVAAGLEPVERMSQLVQERIAQLPLLAALEVAQQRGYAREIEAATRALNDQRQAQRENAAAAREAAALQMRARDQERLALIQGEIKLTRELGVARGSALRGLNGASLEDELARLNAEYDKGIIRQRAAADAVRLLADGQNEAAVAALRRAGAEAQMVDLDLEFGRQEAAIRRVNDQLADMVDLMRSAGALGGVLGGIMGGLLSGNFRGLGAPGELLNVLLTPDSDVADQIERLTNRLEGFFGRFADDIAVGLRNAGIGMAAGALVGGTGATSQAGGALGGILGSIGGEAFKGAITGVASAAFGTALGSAIGSAVPVIGTILGGIAGNLLGGLLGGPDKGSVTLNGSGVTGTMGKSNLIAASQQNADAIIDALARVADALGGTLNPGAGRVSIGVRNGEYRVDPYGRGETKAAGVLNFGADAEAAVAAAIRDLIQDGVLSGIRASAQRLLSAGGDLEAQLEKALAFEGVFKALQESTDPAAAALQQLETQIAGLRRIFDEAGASAEERAALEQLAERRRNEIAEQYAAADDSTNKRRELEIALLTAQGDFMGALAAARAQELAELEPTLRTLQEQVWTAQLANEQRQLEIELMRASGNEAGALAAQRELELASTHEALRGLKEQIWAAEAATRATEDLRRAWGDISSSLEEEVRRIRGLNGSAEGGTFASAMGQFNAATNAARLGDQDAAKSLPGLSQALLRLAAENATSRQELERVQAQTAGSLEQTMRFIAAITGSGTPQSADALLTAIANTQPNGGAGANDNPISSLHEELARLREEVAQLRKESTSGLAAVASHTARTKSILENVTAPTGGDAIATAAAA